MSPAEFEEGVAAGSIVPVTLADWEAQKARDEEELAAAEAEIEAFRQEKGLLDPLVPPKPGPGDETVSLRPDGSFLHKLRLSDGREKTVVTLGRAQVVKEIAANLKSFPTRQNQLEIYRGLHDALTPALRLELGLPDPDELDRQPVEYDREAIVNLNAGLVAAFDLVLPQIKPIPSFLDPLLAQCATEMGAGAGSDRSGNRYGDAACAFRAGGLFRNLDWNHKQDLTCVKDQANRGTCVAFGIVAATEYWVSRKFHHRVNLSEQHLYHRMRFVYHRGDYGDGYLVGLALPKMLEDTGGGYLLPFEHQWNYNPSIERTDDGSRYNQSCDGYAENCSDSTHQSDLLCSVVMCPSPPCAETESAGGCGYSLPEKNPNHYGYRVKGTSALWDPADVETSLLSVMLNLALGTPVILSYSVTASIREPDANGFVSFVEGEDRRGGHVSLAVASVSNQRLQQLLPGAPAGAGGGYVLVKNSWGNCHGDGGYLYLPHDFVRRYAHAAHAHHGVK